MMTRAIVRDEALERAAVAEIDDGEIRDDRGRQHPQAVVGRAEVTRVERQHEQAEEELERQRHIAGADVDRQRAYLIALVPGDRSMRESAHRAPFAKITTLTVSNKIVRSKGRDRCFT
jgi:hypothetical protein